MRTRPPFRVEQLEDRLTPAVYGIPWPDPMHMTISFPADGTAVGNATSTMDQLLSEVGSQPTWQTEILRAFQTWAVNANINIGLVADGGQAMGTPGTAQADPRFGDVRVVARPLGQTTTQVVASTSPFDYSGSTWVGDVLLNSQYHFCIGNVPGKFDLFSVVVHEAGHTFGFPDESTDPSSIMYNVYTGPRPGLSQADIDALRDLYGARQPDAYEGPGGNDTLATAYSLPASQQTAVGDVTTAGDVDYYQFAAPANSATAGLTVRVKTSGISLLVPKLTVFDAAGNAVGSVTASGPLAGDLAVAVPNPVPGAVYYARVEGATGDVFGIGSYKLVIDTTAGSSGGWTYIYNDNHTDDLPAFATPLQPTGMPNVFGLRGSVSDSTDVDNYRVTATGTAGTTTTLTAQIFALDANPLQSVVTVADAFGNPLDGQVVTNDGGTYTVQVPNVQVGSSYTIRVAALNPTGPRNTGNYTAVVDFNPRALVSFDSLGNGSLTTAVAQTYRAVTVNQAELIELSLAADVGTAGTTSGVSMTLFDQTGHAVFSMSAYAGQPLTTATLVLDQGTYVAVFTAGTMGGAPLPALDYTLSKRDLSDPMDAYPVDPGSGTPPPQVTIGGNQLTSPITLLDPVSTPFPPT
jgi:hypothetical protein